MGLFDFLKKETSGRASAHSENKPYTVVRSDSIPIASEEEERHFTKTIGDEYVAKRQLELTNDELEAMSITDGAEMWRLYSWFHRQADPDDTEEKRMLSRKRLDRLGETLAKKVLDADEIYCLYNKRTGEPHLFSRTIQQNGGYLCTPPDIRIFTKAYADHAMKHYPDDLFEMRRIEKGDNGSGIESFLGECFYLNGAQGIEIHSEQAAIDAGMLVPPPDFTGVKDTSIPVMNPDLMRWMLLIAQLPEPQDISDDEELIFRLYYRFMSIEAVKAKFLVPIKPEKDLPKDMGSEKIVLQKDTKFFIAMSRGGSDRDAVMMYTDWKRMRERYDGWSSMVLKIGQIIDVNDAVLNPTSYPRIGAYIRKDTFEEMSRTANKT